VRILKYEKPEIRLLGTALLEIRNPNDKGAVDIIENPMSNITGSAMAYEADE